MPYDAASFKAGFALGRLLWRPPVPEKAKSPAYLTFKSEDNSEFTLSVTDNQKNWNGSLYYSVDKRNWTEWDGITAIHSSGGIIYLRGTGNTKITGYEYGFSRGWSFRPSNTRIYCIGNIENLLDWEMVESGQHPIMWEYCYAWLFFGSNIITPPELPATTLFYNCYESMFSDCASLTTAPELPATTLVSGCYRNMFSNCASLVTAPELPATTLADSCYASMFSGCSSLTTPPELPATTLARHCYYNMFVNCTSLTSAPELVATTMVDSCYRHMFEGCISLITPPELPATRLADFCYNAMFKGCTGLTEPPVLPAEMLSYACYDSMFYGCTSLTTLPKLPAHVMTSSCYRYMFAYCTNIKLSETQDSTYRYPYIIQGWDSSASSQSRDGMFVGTGGTFTGKPLLGTTYYTDHQPVPAT